MTIKLNISADSQWRNLLLLSDLTISLMSFFPSLFFLLDIQLSKQEILKLWKPVKEV